MSPREAARATEACTVHALGAAARAGVARAGRRCGAGSRSTGGAAGRRSCPTKARRWRRPRPGGARCSRSSRSPPGSGGGTTSRVGAAVRCDRGFPRSQPARPPPPVARRTGTRGRGPAVLDARSRRRGARRRAGAARGATTARSTWSGPGRPARGRRWPSGGAFPIPVAGHLGWRVACVYAETLGAPVPPHVLEVLRHGRTGDGMRGGRGARPRVRAPDPGGARRPLRVGHRHALAEDGEEGCMTATPNIAPNYGIDADRVLAIDGPVAWMRRRVDGRFAVDEFGGDPHLMDLVAPLPAAAIRVDVEHAEHLPRTGPALLVSNRGFGLAEPVRARSRRAACLGAPARVWSALRRCRSSARCRAKLGGIGYLPDDVAAMLRAGHLAAAPLGMTWLRSGVGEPPRPLLAATLGFPVVPVAIRAGGPFGLPIGVWPARPWRVVVGEALLPPPATSPDDQLAAAELSEQVRDAVATLLETDVKHAAGRRRLRDRVRRLRPARRRPAADDPGPRHRLAGVGAPADVDEAALPVHRDRQPWHRAAARARRIRCRSTRWRATRSPCSTQRAIATAHVMGASMGGAIAQFIGVRHAAAGAVARARVHGVPQPRVAPRAARGLGRGGRSATGWAPSAPRGCGGSSAHGSIGASGSGST